MKKILAFLLSFILVLGQTALISFADAKEAGADADYENAKETLYALGLLEPAGDKAPNATVTREEFADIIAYFYNTDYELAVSTMSPTGGDKYTGYSNEVIEDDWLWEADKPADEAESEVQETTVGTAYHDVSADSEYYEGIKFVSQLGLMVGYNGYFRPGERITGNEMIKVMVKMMDAEFLTDKNYPFGYLQTAVQLGIISGATGNDFGSFISYRDMVMCFYNMLRSENYVFIGITYSDPENSALYIKNGKTFLENVFKIITVEGIMTSNSVTSLTDTVAAGKGNISINGVIFRTENDIYDDYLGYSVKAYYAKENGDNILYISKDEYNEEIVIQAEDIIDYNRPTLRYWHDDSKIKEVYIGADTLNVINGEFAGGYSAEDIVPKEGYIKLLDNNSDGKNDVVFVENYDIVWTRYVDTLSEIIYDRLSGKAYSLKDRDYRIIDAAGNELTLDNIKAYSVLAIAETTSSVRITVSFDAISGTVTKVDKQNNKITVGEKAYEISEFAVLDAPRLNEYYNFYLDTNGEISAWEKADKDYTYGYLIGIRGEGVFDKTYSAKMYIIGQNKFETLEFGEKINFNDNRTKAEDVANSNLIKNTDDSLKVQVVMYSLDEDKKISELYTADAVSDKFVTVYKYQGGDVRCNGLCYYTDKPLFYQTSDCVLINLPVSNVNNENTYFALEKISGLGVVDITHAYGRSKDSPIADLIVRAEDVIMSDTVNDSGGSVAVITEKAETLKDDEICMELTVGVQTGSPNVYYVMPDTKPYETLNDCKVGDIIRFLYDSYSLQITSAEYIFRKDDMKFSETGYLWELWGHTNPMSTAQWQQWGGETVLLHGVVQNRNDRDGFVGIAPYKYEKNAEGNYYVSGVDTDTIYNLMTNTASVFMYDSQTGEVTAESVNTITDTEVTGSGSQVVTLTKWTGTYLVVIYK